MTSDEINKRAAKVIGDVLEVEAADIKPEASLIEDLGADSLGLIELLLAMEAEFELDTADEETVHVRTVQDVFNLIAQKLPGATRTGARLFAPDPTRFLAEAGLLGEINRVVLHPLGLALTIKTGDAQGEWTFAGLWDARADGEGITFGPDGLAEIAQKLARYMAERGAAAHQTRLRALGFVVEPFEAPAPPAPGDTRVAP